MHGSARTIHALLAGLCLAIPCAAQTARPALEPLDLLGDSFAGIRLAPSVVDGPVTLRATRAWRWTSPGTPLAGGTSSVETQRVLLSGDVSIRLGSYEWSAARAAVWIAPLESSDPDAAPGVFQVFLYLDRVFTPQEDPSVGVAADRLPVQGAVRTTAITLSADANRAEFPSSEADVAFVREGERALAVRLRQRLQGRTPDEAIPDDLVRQGKPVPPLVPGLERSFTPDPALDPRRVPDLERRLGPAMRDEPIFARTGVISWSCRGDVTTAINDAETAVTMTGGVTLHYWERQRDQTLELTAQRAVLFLEPGIVEGATEFDASKVRGVYLEGDVVATVVTSAGRYTIRSPRVYYSIRDDRALLLDAVFWTYDEKRGLPLYIRAKSISQESANTFKASGATLTNTAFFEPDFSIGTSSVTLTRRRDEGGDSRIFVDARNITLNAAGIPFFYWPILRGDPQAIPIRNVAVDSSSGSGTALRTTWNLWSLLGIRPEGDSDADLLVDWHFGRGVGLGTRMNWNRPTAAGGLFVYTLPEDTGRDLLSTGVKKDFDGEWRGLVAAEHRAKISEEWTFAAEGVYISDDTFIDGFFDNLASSRREFISSVDLRRIRDNTALWAATRGTFNDFLSNQYLKQTPGYTVEKTPEVGYARVADDVIDEAPGLLTYSSEYRLSRLRLRFDRSIARDTGFTSPVVSQKAFGINPNQSIADRLKLEGYTDEPVTRFDTRHELGLNLDAGPVNIQPFVVGRLTIYDDEFGGYTAGGGGGNDDATRLWAAQGVTFSTELQRIDNAMESRLFDLHRVRHIVQPSVTVWHASTNVDRFDLPVYDDDVESLAEGAATRFALNQTWQTQRGGPGRWRSVDVFKLNAGITSSSSDVDRESPIGRYIDFRPELSNLGNYGDVSGAWQVSEVLAIGGVTVYDFDESHLQKSALGATLQHAPDFSTYLDLRTINSQDQTFLVLGASYELTTKYTLDLAGAYDTKLGEFQTVSGQITRRFPSVTLGLSTAYNNITSETSVGVIIRPVGASRPGLRLQNLAQPSGG
jgi:hypothetical protein